MLGPLEVVHGDRPVPIPAAKQRIVLATLLLHVNRPVSVGLLIERLWDGAVEGDNARAAVQAHVGRLRAALRVGRAEAPVIHTNDHGYSVEANARDLDLMLFRDLVTRAGRAGDAEKESSLLRQALGLARGPVLVNVPSASLHDYEVSSLTEEQLRVRERWFDAELLLGHHDELIADAKAVTAAHPLRERFWAQLMLALYRSGRQAEALLAYRSVVDLLRGELGVAPGGELRRLHEAILSDDPGLVLVPRSATTLRPLPASPGSTPRAPVPEELPADVHTFTGRGTDLRRIADVLTGEGPGPIGVSVMGAGGTGKSALAVRAAHSVAAHFPDGRLYVNLHGATPDAKPLEPVAALRRFLRSLGVAEADIPHEVDEAAGRFRSLTSGRRVLVVLDNARDAAHVRPLLPGSATCGVVITSRRPLGSLDGIAHHHLGVLPDDEAVALLVRLVGSARVDAEPESAAELVRLCGNLPLALRMAAARLTTRPSWPVSGLVGRLATEHRRLSELRAGDRAVRTSFLVSYRDLLEYDGGAGAALLFRLLGLLDIPDFSVSVVAALASVPHDHAEDLLDHLVDAQLVENPAPGRFAMHDLLRLFARERAAEQESGERRGRAVHDVQRHYLAVARAATGLLRPQAKWRCAVGVQEPDLPRAPLATKEDVYSWTDAEVGNVLAVVAEAAEAGDHDVVAGLAAAFAFPLYDRGRWGDQLVLFGTAVRSAERSKDPFHLAVAYSDRGWARSRLGHLHEAISDLRRSLDAYFRVGDLNRAATQYDGLGGAYRRLGEFDESIRNYRRAIDLFAEQGSSYAQGGTMSNLGVAYQHAGRHEEAIDAHTRAIALLRESGDPLATAAAVGNLAEAHRLAGDLRQAVGRYEEALALDHQEGLAETYWAAEHSWGLGLALYGLGEGDRARERWRRSAVILHSLGLIGADERDAIEAADVPSTPEIIERHL